MYRTSTTRSSPHPRTTQPRSRAHDGNLPYSTGEFDASRGGGERRYVLALAPDTVWNVVGSTRRSPSSASLTAPRPHATASMNHPRTTRHAAVNTPSEHSSRQEPHP